MSTRSNITIDLPTRMDSDVLYRHYDGYPAVGGAALLEPIHRAETRLKNMRKNQHKFDHSDARIWSEVRAVLINGIFCAGRGPCEADHRDADTRQLYEFTGALHGDIEYHYKITAREVGRGLRIYVAEKPRFDGDDFPSLDDWADDGDPMTPDAFCRLVNRERGETNDRLRDMHGEDADLMPALDVDGSSRGYAANRKAATA